MNKCIICKKTLGNDEPKFMVAYDFPYLNIFVHRECVLKISNEELQKIIENDIILPSRVGFVIK